MRWSNGPLEDFRLVEVVGDVLEVVDDVDDLLEEPAVTDRRLGVSPRGSAIQRLQK